MPYCYYRITAKNVLEVKVFHSSVEAMRFEELNPEGWEQVLSVNIELNQG